MKTWLFLNIITHVPILHICSELLSLLGPQGTVFPTGIQTQPIKAVSLTDEMKKIKNIGENERKGREILYTQESKTFLKGFWVPYTWGNLYVLVSEH